MMLTLTNCFQEEIPMLNYDKTNTYTTSTNNAVGPTTSSTLRTVTAHNDTNCKYIAMNGDDTTGDGTAALPYLTIDKALSEIAGAFVIVTAIRNSYVGDMIFDAPDSVIPAGTTVQVEIGETATIKKTDYSWEDTNSLTKAWGKGTFGDDIFVMPVRSSDKIYYSTDALTWTACNCSTLNWIEVVYCNGYFIAIAYGDKIYYASSAQVLAGTAWTASNSVSANWKSIGTDGTNKLMAGQDYPNDLYTIDIDDLVNNVAWTINNQLSGAYGFAGITYGDSTWAVVVDTTITLAAIYTSTDAVNFTKLTSIFFATGAYNLIYGNGRWVFSPKTGNAYYSDDLITWFETDLPDNPGISITYAEGKWICKVGGANVKVYYSFNGANWIDTGSTGVDPSYNYSIVYGNDLWLLANSDSGTPEVIKYINDSVVYITNNGVEINGFYLDGNDWCFAGIWGNDNTTYHSQWNMIQSCLKRGIMNFDQPQINNDIIQDLEDIGIGESDSPVIYDSLFYNIDNIGIDHYGITIDIEHCTIYDCGIGIKFNETISTTTALKNHIFRSCSYSIYSQSTTVVLTNSVIDKDISLSNVTADSTNEVGAKSLFHDINADDYHLRHLQEGYPVESPGILLADDSRDAGAWDVTFSLDSTAWLNWNPDPKKVMVARMPMLIKPDSGVTLGKNYKRTTQGKLRRWEITVRDTAATTDLQHLENVILYDDPLQWFPVGQGKQSSTATAAFVWQTKTDVDGIVKMTVSNATDLANIDTLLGGVNPADETFRDSPIGLWVMVKSITGTSSPFSTSYPMKIVKFEKTSTPTYIFYLENIYSKFPGTGMGANPDGAYNWDLVKAEAVLIGQYQDDNADGYIEFELDDLSQTLIKNQWSGFWLHIDYTDALGSREYYKIVGNINNEIYCENSLGLVSTLVDNTYYYLAIDLVMAKSEPKEMTTNKADNNDGHNKHGNDWYSTKVTREENTIFNNTGSQDEVGYQSYNETGEQVILIESEDVDGDGL